MVDDRFNANKTICMRQHLLFLFFSSSTNRLQNSAEGKKFGYWAISHSVLGLVCNNNNKEIKQNTETQLRWSYWNNENRKETRINILHTQRLSHWF